MGQDWVGITQPRYVVSELVYPNSMPVGCTCLSASKQQQASNQPRNSETPKKEKSCLGLVDPEEGLGPLNTSVSGPPSPQSIRCLSASGLGGPGPKTGGKTRHSRKSNWMLSGWRSWGVVAPSTDNVH